MDDRDKRSDRRGGWIVLLFLAAGAAAAWLLWSAVPEGEEARFVYLVLLALFIGSGVVWAVIRAPLSRTLRHGAIWLAILAVLFVGYSFRDELRYVADRVAGDLVPERGYGAGEGEISFRAGQAGHFSIEAEVDGTPVVFLVDTGASDVVLTRQDAARLGFDPAALDYYQVYQTANGRVLGAPVRLEQIRIGPIVVDNVKASVNQAPMPRSLLGMSFLNRIGGWRVEGDVLTLHAP